MPTKFSKYKVGHRKSFITREHYKLFKAKFPDDPTTYKEFIAILKESTVAIRDHILDNQLGFKLPYNLGYLAIDKFKGLPHYVAVDWPNSRRLGRRIPLLNLHSFGYFYKIKFYKNPKKQPLYVYMMTPHRVINRMINKKIRSGMEYIGIERSYFSNRFRIGEHIKELF